MQSYRPDWVVRLLTILVSVAYYVLLALGTIVLVALPLLRVFAGDDPDWTVDLNVPVSVQQADAAVQTAWGEARLEIEDVEGSLELPIGRIPWWLFGVSWAYAAAIFGLTLGFLHNLRRIFQRVRAGAPFDATNALRLRRLGLLALAIVVFEGTAQFITALAVRQAVVQGGVTVPAGLSIDMTLVFFVLVLLALAEIFRRGAELEDEQALTI